MKCKDDLKGMTKEELQRHILHDCPSDYGLNDAAGCDGSGTFSCRLCWECALEEVEEGL